MSELEQAAVTFGRQLTTILQGVIEKATVPLAKRIGQLEATTDEWVSTTDALKLTGIKSNDTLRKMRDKEGSLLKAVGVGRGVKYSRASCIAFAESKRLGRDY